MRGVVEVPLKTINGTNVGTLHIDQDGRVKIEMKGWAKPSEIGHVLDYVRGMSNTISDLGRNRS